MQNNKIEGNKLHQVVLQAEDILDQAVYEKVWIAIGDYKETDLAHLIKQGRISDSSY